MKFETINNTPCRMVEPEPLTTDAKFPCAVRLIQDESPMGMFNKEQVDYYYGVALKLCLRSVLVGSIDDRSQFDTTWEYHRYEIIGYPVVDGSAEWAFYQHKQGHVLSNPKHGLFRHQFLSDDAALECIKIYQDGWVIDSEPKPAFKAGDWVEIEVAGVISQHRVKYGVFANSINAGGIEFYGNGLPVMKPLNARIIRKLDPSEVRVKVVLEGAIERHDGNPQYWFKLRSSEYNYALISIDMLDTPTRSFVESLLKAQGGAE